MITRRKDQLGGKRAGARSQSPRRCRSHLRGEGTCSNSTGRLCKSDSRGRRRGLNKNGSLEQSGLEGAGAPRARSRARRATGHGARGRTGRVRSPGGAGRRCAAPSAAHSRGFTPACGSSAAWTGTRRLPTEEGDSQTHMHFAAGCLRNPASHLASLATLRTRAFPEVTQKRQKGNGLPQSAGISSGHDPDRRIQEAKLRTRAPVRTERWLLAGLEKWRGQDGRVRVWILSGCPGGWRGGSWAGGGLLLQERPGGS